MPKTPLISIFCVLVAAVLGATGQYLFKAAADRATRGLAWFLIDPWALLGICCYAVVMMFFAYGFRRGGTVTVLYPIYATTFIWAAVAGQLFYHQPIRPIHVLGMLLLIAGMYLMGIGNAAP